MTERNNACPDCDSYHNGYTCEGWIDYMNFIAKELTA